MTWVSLFWFGLGLLYVPQQLIMAAVRGASDSDPVIVLSNFGIWIIWAMFTPIVWRITTGRSERAGWLTLPFACRSSARRRTNSRGFSPAKAMCAGG